MGSRGQRHTIFGKVRTQPYVQGDDISFVCVCRGWVENALRPAIIQNESRLEILTQRQRWGIWIVNYNQAGFPPQPPPIPPFYGVKPGQY